MKKVIALLLALMLVVSLAACGSSAETETAVGSEAAEETAAAGSEAAEEPEAAEETAAADEDTAEEGSDEESVTIRLAGLTGPTTIGMVELLEKAAAGETEDSYEFTLAGAADEITPSLIKGELDIVAVPVNLASVLYNKTEGNVQMLAINTLGVLYIVEKGEQTISSLEDLRGRTIYATGKGSTPEYALTYLLAQNGLDIENDVTIEWKSEPSEVVAQMAAEDNAVAMLPQPYVTVAQTQVEDLNVVLDLTEEWDALDNGSQLLTACLLVRKDFAEENPEAVAAFLEEYAASVAYVNENPADAAVLVESWEIAKAAVAEKAIPYCNIVCITGEEMAASADGYLQILYDQNPEAVGGTLPADDFYWLG